MATVHITGWRMGFEKVRHTQALQSATGLPLSQAKAITDAVLAGQVMSVDLVSLPAAQALVARLQELGAIASANE